MMVTAVLTVQTKGTVQGRWGSCTQLFLPNKLGFGVLFIRRFLPFLREIVSSVKSEI